MKRRNFLSGVAAAVGGLVLPSDPSRIYSFPSESFLNRPRIELAGCFRGTDDQGDKIVFVNAFIHSKDAGLIPVPTRRTFFSMPRAEYEDMWEGVNEATIARPPLGELGRAWSPYFTVTNRLKDFVQHQLV